MGVQFQAALVKAPEFRQTNFDGTANTVSNSILYTADTTHKVNELPASFHGKYVRVRSIGGALDFLFTDKATHETDRALVATDAGLQSEKLGGYLADGEVGHFRVPTPPLNGKIYFSRESSAAASVRIEEGSD